MPVKFMRGSGGRNRLGGSAKGIPRYALAGEACGTDASRPISVAEPRPIVGVAANAVLVASSKTATARMVEKVMFEVCR